MDAKIKLPLRNTRLPLYVSIFFVLVFTVILLINFTSTEVFGFHGVYDACGSPGDPGFCVPDLPVSKQGDIAQNLPWCHAGNYTCAMACEGVGGPPCDAVGFFYDWDDGTYLDGHCSAGVGNYCRVPDNCGGFSQWGIVDCDEVGGPGPTATCSPVSQSANVGERVDFTGSASGGISPYTYSWSAPGGTPSSASTKNFSNVSYSSASPSNKTVTLTVTDDGGSSDTAQCTVTIGGGGGGSGSVDLGPLTTTVRRSGSGSYADSFTGAPPVNLDVRHQFQIISGCTSGAPCNFRYLTDCTNNGSFENTTPQFNRLNGNYSQTLNLVCPNMPNGNYSLRGRVEVWPASNSSDVTWKEDLVPISISSPAPLPAVSIRIQAINNISEGFSLKDVKQGDILTFDIEYRNAGTGDASGVQNVTINLSNNHQYVNGSLDCWIGPGSCNNINDSNPQQIRFNRNSSLNDGEYFTVRFDTIVNTTSNTQPFEILTVNTTGTFNPGALGFDTTYALLAAPNRPPAPGFKEVAP